VRIVSVFPGGCVSEEAAVVVVSLDPIAAKQLARALADFTAWCRTNGLKVAPALDALAALSGTERRRLDDFGDRADTLGMAPILLSYDEAATVLCVSERMVRSLVHQGDLPAVSIGRARRIHREDLDAYADSLRAKPSTNGSDS
jgi:excisionase family DNA binding protein